MKTVALENIKKAQYLEIWETIKEEVICVAAMEL